MNTSPSPSNAQVPRKHMAWKAGRKFLRDISDKATRRLSRTSSESTITSKESNTSNSDRNLLSHNVVPISKQNVARFKPFGYHSTYEDDAILASFLEHSNHRLQLENFHLQLYETKEGFGVSTPSERRMAFATPTRGSARSVSTFGQSFRGSSEGNEETFALFHEALLTSKVFSLIETELAQALHKAAVRITVNKNELVYCQGQSGSLLFVVVEGQIQKRARRSLQQYERVIETCGPGSLLCEGAVFGPLVHKHTAVISSEKATLMALHRVEYQLAVLQFAETHAASENDKFDFLNHLYLFQALSREQRTRLFRQIEWHSLTPSHLFLREERAGPGLIIVEQGELIVQIEYRKRDRATLAMMKIREEVRCLRKGELFGEAAVLSESLRSKDLGYRLVAGPNGAKLALISNKVMSTLLTGVAKQCMWPMLRNLHIAHALANHPVFSGLTRMEIMAIAQIATIFRIEADHLVDGHCGLWLVLDGAMTLFRQSEPFVSLTAGDCFGDANLLVGPNTLGQRSFGSHFFPTSPEYIARAGGELICALVTHKVMTQLGITYSQKCLNDTELLEENQLHTLPKNTGIHLETSLNPGELKEIESVPASTHILAMEADSTESHVIISVEQSEDSAFVHNAAGASSQQDSPQIVEAPNKNKGLISARLATLHREDLILLRRIYTAPYSKLYFARHQPTGQVLVIKEIADLSSLNASPDRVSTRASADLSHSALVEIALLLELATTNIVPRVLSMTDEPDRALMIIGMEPMTGGDLGAFIQKRQIEGKGPLEVDSFRFYAANLIHALKILFENDILHRDIKPANIVIDSSGYLRLIDFGISKGRMCGETARTSTLCGTPKYMAPEIARLVLGRGVSYGLAVDWWALGCTLFELACGFNPFEFNSPPSKVTPLANESGESRHVNAPDLHLILHRIIRFADQCADAGCVACHELAPLAEGFQHLRTLGPDYVNASSLILRLLHPSSYLRLGVGPNGPRGAMEHPFFEQFSWRDLANRSLPAPFSPAEPAFYRSTPSGDNTAARRKMLLERCTKKQAAVFDETERVRHSSSPLVPTNTDEGQRVELSIEDRILLKVNGRLSMIYCAPQSMKKDVRLD